MSESSIDKGKAAAIRSPFAWSLLGLIIERPSHGYEFAQRFKRVYGNTLVLSSPLNVYRLLETLSNHGLIEEVPQDAQEQARTSRPKLHYRVTPQGRRAYEEWLVTQVQEERKRSQLFARQLAMLEPEDAIEVIERYEHECLTEAHDESDEDPESVAERLAYEDERLSLGVRLSWFEYARRELETVIKERGRRPKDAL
jgi:DNA-binding PadR family transcriptional regulator